MLSKLFPEALVSNNHQAVLKRIVNVKKYTPGNHGNGYKTLDLFYVAYSMSLITFGLLYHAYEYI